MTSIKVKRRIVRSLGIWMASSCLGAVSMAPAFAQEVPIPPPFMNTDGNGVDLTSGTYSFGVPVGSIGTGNGAMSLVENFGWLQGNNLQIGFRRTVSSGQATISITLGNRSETFVGAAGATTFSVSQGTGATLTKVSAEQYVYTDADGTVTDFGWPGNLGYQGGTSGFCSTISQNGTCTLLARSTSFKSGLVVTRNWRAGETCIPVVINGEPAYSNCAHFFRLTSIQNNYGYRIAFAYQNNTDPTTGLPASTWYVKTSATFSNVNDGSITRTATYAYPSTTVTEITDYSGGLWRITRVNGVTLASIRRAGSSTDNIQISAATNGQVTQVIADGVTTNYAYTSGSGTATMVVTNALSQNTIVVTNTAVGRPTSVQDALGRTTSYAYDSNSRLLLTTAPEGNSVAYRYDSRGNIDLTTYRAKSGSGLVDITTSAAFPATCTNIATCNSPTSTTNARGKITNYEYDPTHGGVTKITAPQSASGIRPETRYSYTQLASGPYVVSAISTCQSTASCVGTANEVKTTLAYDSNARPVSRTTAAGDGSLSATETIGYNALGDVTAVDGPLAGTVDRTIAYYDAGRRLMGIVGPDPDDGGALTPRARRYSYNAIGQITVAEVGAISSQSAPFSNFYSYQQVTSTYDANSRKVKDVTTAGGGTQAVTQYSYDNLGRIECTALRMNSAVWGALPGSACSLGTAGSAGPDRISRNSYDALSRVTKVQSAYGTAAQIDEVTRTFTNNGQLATLSDAKNNRTTYEYDGFDRLSKTRYPDPATAGQSAASDYEQLGYDAGSNVTSVRLRDGQSIALGYDDLGRLIAKDRPWSEPDVSYAYDLLGKLTSASQSGNALAFTYDALGRNLTQSGPLGTVSYQYDLAGRRTRMTWPDGFYVGYTYNNANDLTGIGENSTTALLTSTSYDDLARRTGLYRANGAHTYYAYDGVSRLTGLTHDLPGTAQDLTLGFGYSPASQITQTTRSNDSYAWNGHVDVNRPYTVNGLNQYTQAGALAIAHDARGNLVTSGSSSYAYSSENYLISGPGVTLNYDPMGRLYQTSGSATTRFLYDGQDLIGEYDAVGNRLRRYVHGGGTDEPLVWYEGSGTTDRRFLHSDERGSIVAITNGAGNAITINSYDEYGIPASGNVGRFQYTGQTWIPELGMYYYKARFYSPTLGRFMQTDPIGYGDGMNLYAYVGNDPVNGRDPSGLAGQERNEHVEEIIPTGDEYVPDITVTGQCRGSSCDPKPGNSAVGAPAASPGGGGAGGEAVKENDDIVVTAQRNPNNSLILLAAQRGGNNQRSSEFQNMSDEQVADEYEKSSGERKQKLQRELKARGIRNLNKFRGGGIMRLPFLFIITPILEQKMKEFQCMSNPNCVPEA